MNPPKNNIIDKFIIVSIIILFSIYNYTESLGIENISNDSISNKNQFVSNKEKDSVRQIFFNENIIVNDPESYLCQCMKEYINHIYTKSKLKKVYLKGCSNIDIEDIFINFKDLESLILESSKIDNLMNLKEFPNLKELKLLHCIFNESDSFPSLSKLEILCISGFCELASLKGLANCKNL